MARVAGMTERLDREKRKLNEKTRALKEMSKTRKADAATIGHLEARNRELAAQVQTLQPDTATQAKNNAEKKQFEKTIQTLTAWAASPRCGPFTEMWWKTPEASFIIMTGT
jgi:hypothetical protein